MLVENRGMLRLFEKMEFDMRRGEKKESMNWR
jgi:hypothetical protein